MMCKDHQYKDARELIFQEMAHLSTTHSSIQDVETTDCLAKLQHSFTPPWNLSGSEKADLNLLESKQKVTPCQTPRECQTRSPDYLKKPSMNQHAQQISATTSQHAEQSTQQISATPELELPQSGSEDDDEAWLTDFKGCEAPSRAAEAYTQLDEYWKTTSPFHPTPTTHSVAEPVLLRTPDSALSASADSCDLPGPLSRDDDEDSSPRTQDLDLAEHTSCSTRDLTTLGQESTALTHQGLLIGSPTRKDAQASANLTGTTCKGHPVIANLTLCLKSRTLNATRSKIEQFSQSRWLRPFFGQQNFSKFNLAFRLKIGQATIISVLRILL